MLRRSLMPLFILALTVGSALPAPARAMLYRTPSGTLKDNCVVWHDGKYYLLTMYREEVDGADLQFNDMWLATSADGVHWKDVGPVIHNAPFPIWAIRAWKVGDRFVLNHGSWTTDQKSLLRFWESDDLIHWKYLGEEYDVRRPDGKRLDHMDVVKIEEGGRTQWYGYACGGLLRSEDGVKWTWKEDFQLTDKNWGVGETGGCQRIGERFYLLGGNWQDPRLPGNAKGLPGDAGYSVLTFVANRPEGPFRPDYTALRLNGHSGRRIAEIWACYCRLPGELLLSSYIADPHTPVQWWHAPLKKAVVDSEGHLRMGYWRGNDAMKGAPVPLQPRNCTQIFPMSESNEKATEAAFAVEGDAVRLARRPGKNATWMGYDKPRTAVAVLDERFDVDKGFILEGRMKVERFRGGLPSVGLFIEERPQRGTAVLFHAHRLTEIGTLRLDDDARFDCEDRAGFGCATVAGIEAGKDASFRLLFRKGMFELYLNDLFVQSYCADKPTGRIGFVVRDGKAAFDNLKAWATSL
ncbi:MAG: hypothetical protein JW959_04030 [Pirellulales bacterium]|nr:hypothetical protein [Pirellulales bacterium]